MRNYSLLLLLLPVLVAGCRREPASTPGEPPLFEQLPAEQTGVDFMNTVENTERYNIIQYLYYYNGGGVSIGDMNDDGLPDLFFTANRQPNRLYLNRGDFHFEDVTESAGIAGKGDWKTGTSMVDINADGLPDIYVCQVGKYKRFRGRNELFVNQGDGTFREEAAAYGLDFVGFSQQATWTDYDGDGDLDCFLLNHSVHSPSNYQGAEVRQRRDTLAGDRLYRNDGGGFTDVSSEAGIYGGRIGFGLGLVVSDFDRNGWDDIYVANDFHENDYLYLNQGDGTFREQLVSAIGHTSRFSMGVDAGDLNNDGWPDLLSLDMKPEDEVIKKQSVGPDPYNIFQFKVNYGYHYQYARNMLQVNQGVLPEVGLRFSEIGTLTGLSATDWSWATLFADLDNDRDKDIFITNGIWTRPNDLDYLKYISSEEIQESASDVELITHMPEGLVSNYAFQNLGDWQFEPVARSWGLDLRGCSNGAAYADLDADGDLDLVVNNLNQTAAIYRNRSRERGSHYLQLVLRGPSNNPLAFGAQVRLYAGGEVQTESVNPVRGWQSSVEPLVHFGLGEAGTYDSLVIRWPDRRRQVLRDLPVDTRSEVQWSDAWPTASAELAENRAPYRWQAVQETGLDVIHRENDFTDFNMEKLLPYELSEEGPCLAVGDVNGDGIEDLFFGAAKGQESRLLLGQSTGRFTAGDTDAFAGTLLLEDTDAVFFDADGDGDTDLFVLSGGGEYPEGSDKLSDRLYINDAGTLRLTTDRIPESGYNGACVVAADFDGDGDSDLFVGNRSVPRSYGILPESYVLWNDGTGRFSRATEDWLPEEERLGMVTDAVWLADRQQLVVVGHWMPVTIIDFSQGQPKVEQRTEFGWWNCVEAADIDGNGRADILLGNLGWNTDLGRGNPEQPVGLYVHDFDDNYAIDPILTYYRNGVQVPFFWKDELSNQVLPLKKKFVEYRRFASSTLEDVFEPAQLEAAQYRRADFFGSAVWWDAAPKEVLQLLPDPVQWSSVEAIEVIGDQIILAGNRDGFSPALGRQDASLGWVLKYRGNRQFELQYPRETGLVLPGFVRDLVVVNELLVVGRNNERPLLYQW